MKIKLIVAASTNNVIGFKNDLPWSLPDDMLFFKKKTQNSVVIMGKNNYLSLPEKFRPLPNRLNIVLTRKSNFIAPNCIITSTLENAIVLAKKKKKKIFIIGGGLVYKYAIENDLIDTIYLTRVHAHIKGDTFFPNLNMKKWQTIHECFHNKDEQHSFAFTFLKLEKKSTSLF